MDNKDRFIGLLQSTARKGIEEVIVKLGETDFYTAPASTAFHLNNEGGLLQHSLNVYDVAMMLREQMIALNPELESALPSESIAIAALLHDTCKADIYKKTIKSRKNAYGTWDKYMGYEADYSSFPAGHGEKSVIELLRWGLEMTDDEILAIRWHMTAWELAFQSSEQKANLTVSRDRYPLCTIIQCADSLASNLLEKTTR